MSAKIATYPFLQSLYSIPNINRSSIPFLTCTVLALLNRPEELTAVISHAAAVAASSPQNQDSAPSPRRVAVEKAREALLKATVIGGYPCIINALHSLNPAETGEPARQLRKESIATPKSVYENAKTLWDRVYGKVANKVSDNLESSYPDLEEMIKVAYGVVLAEETVLDAKESELVFVAALAVGGKPWELQMKGHRHGCVNMGASWEEVDAVETLAKMVIKEVGKTEREEAAAEGMGTSVVKV
jgi:alkylhydroperoxidase/carboxymuconolactone decarboxylase family protein YurZ